MWCLAVKTEANLFMPFLPAWHLQLHSQAYPCIVTSLMDEMYQLRMLSTHRAADQCYPCKDIGHGAIFAY
jgi:hypothetical protein